MDLKYEKRGHPVIDKCFILYLYVFLHHVTPFPCLIFQINVNTTSEQCTKYIEVNLL